MTGQTVILSTARARETAHRLVDAAPVGAVLNLRPATRSTDQNAKMWAMLSDISRAKPRGIIETADTWKCLAMHACGFEVQFLQGLDGRPFPAGFRSSRLTKDQMSQLIEWLYAFGAENGVAWSDEARAA